MNLLMITGDRSLAQGKKGAFYNTLSELHKYFDRIDVICPRTKGQDVGFFENVHIHPSPWPLAFQWRWILKKGIEIYRGNPFQIFTCHEYPPFYNGLGAWLLWRKIKVPYILEIMHIPGYPKSAGIKERVYKFIFPFFIRFSAKHARAVRVINQREAPGFLKKVGVPESKLIYIPAFYIDTNVFYPQNLAKEFDLVYAARLEKNKGLNILIKVVEEVKNTNPLVKLLIIGQGPERSRMEREVRHRNLSSNIIFSGWLKDQSEVAGMFNKSRIFINVAFNEGGPRVVLEAMACGLPIISTPVGVMVDVIKDEENSFLVDWQPSFIAHKIGILLIDADLYRRFSEEGRRLVLENFEKKKAVENYAQKLISLTCP